MNLDIYRVEELEPKDRATLERHYGGELEEIAFVVAWWKYSDYADNGGTWDGWPFTAGYAEPIRVDDSDNWKATWFLFRAL